MDLKISTYREEDVNILKLVGDLDIHTSPDFKKEVLDFYLANPADIIIDAQDLDYIDSTGLGAFMSIYKKSKDQGHAIILRKVKPNVRKIFVITDLDRIFVIEE